MHKSVEIKYNPDDYLPLLNRLQYGKDNAKKSETLWIESGRPGALSYFRRIIRSQAHLARLNGHWVVADDYGYYLALSKEEWNRYKLRRLASFKDEITALAKCDRTTISDLIKNIFSINLDDPNYELF